MAREKKDPTKEKADRPSGQSLTRRRKMCAGALKRFPEKKTVRLFESLDELPPEDARRLLHELQVHQIELEMQNEELQRAREELDESHARYADLYDFAPVGYFTFDRQGLVQEVNLTGAEMLGMTKGQQ